MRSAWIITILLCIGVSLATFDCADCTLPRVRYRFKSLTSSQQYNYLRAVQELKNYQEVPYAGAEYTLSLYDIFSLTHSANVDAAFAHGSDGFFVWHRHYMWLYETALQEVVTKYNYNLQASGATTGFLDACVTVPYWDWENDYQKETQCSLFSSSTFGTYTENACVTTGMFTNWAGADGYCLWRSLDVQTNGGIAVGAAQIINFLVGKETYTTYRSNIEGQPHGSVHNWVGGSEGNMGNMWSPDDPLFFVHHSNIDRLWALFQDCYDYEKLTTSQITSKVFPTSWPQAANPSIIYKNNQPMPYNVDLDGSTFTSYRFSTPVTPLDIQSMGYQGPAANGMYYRYGAPDLIVTSLNSNRKYNGICNFNSWVNYTPPTSPTAPTAPTHKRSAEQIWFDYAADNDTESNNDTIESEETCLFGSKRLQTVMDNIEHKYSRHHPSKKLHYLALWECSDQNKLPDRNYSVPLKWCKMNHIDPADWKTVCEKEGQTNGYQFVADMEEQQLATNDQNQQPAWVLPVSISAGVVVLLVIIAIVVFFIVRRNRSDSEQY